MARAPYSTFWLLLPTVMSQRAPLNQSRDCSVYQHEPCSHIRQCKLCGRKKNNNKICLNKEGAALLTAPMRLPGHLLPALSGGLVNLEVSSESVPVGRLNHQALAPWEALQYMQSGAGPSFSHPSPQVFIQGIIWDWPEEQGVTCLHGNYSNSVSILFTPQQTRNLW